MTRKRYDGESIVQIISNQNKKGKDFVKTNKQDKLPKCLCKETVNIICVEQKPDKK